MTEGPARPHRIGDSTTLETAYSAGFFDWPREQSGEDVAEMLDVPAGNVLPTSSNGPAKGHGNAAHSGD
ncbi:helix-turn-helix domain-containing protein [Natrinema sp. SYSU A 869]|uniref:helix-turn-helix domain-containing protein n=1 Tax=Natrinema sp. SYSU A 869 TaxID=2871694 RepID=UPI001CA4020A|nr:helix-turn-helix domain-containing protein [Natrinema sp. SYSU A 869]